MADILVVDDEPNIRRMLASLLAAEGHAATQAASGEDGIAAIESAQPDVVLLDLALPGADGVEILAQIRTRWPTLPVIMMSGRATLSDAVRATKLGAFHFIEKPLSPESVLLTVASAIELRRARELSRTLMREMRDLGTGERLVGSSALMQQTRAGIDQIARTDARVLITGESGTGKELAATALHEQSSRAGGPFVRVNSAAIPTELVESEMFGHERGSFTGAHERRLGKFELAHGGTLFLDEVGDLGASAQAKLLRALESGEVERVGGQHPVRVDVRVIAATNKDLTAERSSGSFRDDLYFRLNVIRLHMPPLRERASDIPELIDHFMTRLQQRHGLERPSLQEDALLRMQSYAWPGNVRELANVCERLAILNSGRRVTKREIAAILAVDNADAADAGEENGLTERLDAMERRMIDEALAAAGGNIADAARHLKTDRANLYRRMRRLGIILSAVLVALLGASPATRPLTAQVTGQVAGQAAARVTSETLIPDSAIQRLIGVYNREGTTRLNGDSRIPAGSTLTGDVAVLNGTLEIGGHITGDVVALNGDLHLLATAVVDGNVTAAGGAVRIDDGAKVAGSSTSYRELLRLRVDGDRVAYVRADEESGITAGRDFAFGRTDLLLAVRGSYNRVEGLPIAFGPRIRLGTTTRIQALVTYRTANGFPTAADKFGYAVNADHHISSNISIAASVFREIATIESWDLSAREASLAAFVLHRDYRDHYDRRGWSAGARFQRAGGPSSIGIIYRDETDKSVAPHDPFALLHNDDAWRPEPLIAEGRLHSVIGAFDYDTRNDARDPSDGWLMRTTVELGIGGSLATPVESGLPLRTGQERFTTALVDVRRYARLTPYSRVAIRIRAEGALDARAAGLPAQRQLTLGGEGSLPAYPMAQFDCGASRTVAARGAAYTAFHGCDRLALAQIEYQASFPFARKIAERLRLGSWLTNSVRWSAFFDAGRAWTEPDSRNGRGHGRDDFSADAGLGVRLGPLGLYWAVPLSGSDHQYNFFMRLGPRL